jgi:glycogen synthase
MRSTSRRSIRRAPDPALQAELGLQGKTVLGFLGSFYAYEGLDLLLDAMPQLLAQTRISACCWSVAGRRSRH